MRVFLSSARPEFSEVLETAFRSAGLSLAGIAKVERPRSLGFAAAHSQPLSEREGGLRTSTPSDFIDSYLEHNNKRGSPHVAKAVDTRSIADELRITAQMTVSDLTRLRREFALTNHPDRASSTDREIATRRMMAANMLIDCAMKGRRQPEAVRTKSPRN